MHTAYTTIVQAALPWTGLLSHETVSTMDSKWASGIHDFAARVRLEKPLKTYMLPWTLFCALRPKSLQHCHPCLQHGGWLTVETLHWPTVSSAPISSCFISSNTHMLAWKCRVLAQKTQRSRCHLSTAAGGLRVHKLPISAGDFGPKQTHPRVQHTVRIMSG